MSNGPMSNGPVRRGVYIPPHLQKSQPRSSRTNPQPSPPGKPSVPANAGNNFAPAPPVSFSVACRACWRRWIALLRAIPRRTWIRRLSIAAVIYLAAAGGWYWWDGTLGAVEKSWNALDASGKSLDTDLMPLMNGFRDRAALETLIATWSNAEVPLGGPVPEAQIVQPLREAIRRGDSVLDELDEVQQAAGVTSRRLTRLALRYRIAGWWHGRNGAGFRALANQCRQQADFVRTRGRIVGVMRIRLNELLEQASVTTSFLDDMQAHSHQSTIRDVAIDTETFRQPIVDAAALCLEFSRLPDLIEKELKP